MHLYCLYSELVVDLQNKNVLNVFYSVSLDLLFFYLVLTDGLGNILRNTKLTAIFFLFIKPIPQNISICMPNPTKSLLNLTNIYLANPQIIKLIPFPSFLTPYITIIMPSASSTTVNKYRIQLIYQRTIIQVLLCKLGDLELIFLEFLLFFEELLLFLGFQLLHLLRHCHLLLGV